MKCYYEELGVERDANLSEIKIAYRKLALMWHPDKNPDCMLEAKEQFQLIQQAYEVLSDPQERAWYDNHREQILRGKNSEYEDNCLDVFQYFTVSCFVGYGDDEKGFYAVYREVFKKISAEDAEFMECEEELRNTPLFGDSKSSYEEVVGPFYAYWSAYCTKRTYAWLCPYDIREIKDRKILREIAKDMKKVVQKAKKERNDAVRNLVAFVRKRDKRVLAYKKVLEERSARNKQKHAQNRLEQIKRRQQELVEMIQNSGATNENDDYQERLRLLEQQYSTDDEHLEDDDLVLQESYEVYDELYCVACNKDFKTERAFANHEISRKHRDNIERLKIKMQSEEDTYQQDEKYGIKEEIDIEAKEEDNTNTLEYEEDEKEINKTKFSKQKKKNDIKKTISLTIDQDIQKQNVEAVAENFYLLQNTDEDDGDWSMTKRKFNKKVKCKNKENKHNLVLLEKQYSNTKDEVKYASKSVEKPGESESEITQHICATCKTKFESKNKLFAHLKLLNHGVFIPKTKALNDNTKSKKSKGKRNS